MIKLTQILNELGIKNKEPNLHLYHFMNINKKEIWDKLIYSNIPYKDFNIPSNFNPETDIEFILDDFSGEKEYKVIYLKFKDPQLNIIGFEASLNPDYFYIREDETISIKSVKVKDKIIYYITYDI